MNTKLSYKRSEWILVIKDFRNFILRHFKPRNTETNWNFFLYKEQYAAQNALKFYAFITNEFGLAT